MTEPDQLTNEQRGKGLSRRDLLRRSAVGGATLAGVSTGAIRLDHGPVQESQAIAPAVVAGGIAASAATGWALRETEVLGSNPPGEGMTADALTEQIYNTTKARYSNNQSTFFDNKNIIENIQHAAYADGKMAAIEALNDQLSQDEVQSAASSAIDDYETTILKNFLNSWNESLNELGSMIQTVDDHPDLGHQSVWDPEHSVTNASYEQPGDDTYELPDGSTFDIKVLKHPTADGTFEQEWTPIEERDAEYETTVHLNPSDYDRIVYLSFSEWNDLFDSIRSEFEAVRDDISIYVSKIYDKVQSGELDTSELLTPREQAELTAEDEDFPQAIADLQALNIGVDLEREAEIHLPDIDATLYGQLAYQGDADLEVGQIDPDATDDDDEPLYPGTIYFNYDVSQGQGEWDAYDDGIDGGTLTLTSEPFEETIYYVDTAAGETAEFVTDDLSEDDDGDEWTIDLSDQLDDQITEVDQIEYYADTEETQYETIQLQDTFEIVRFTDSDGNEYEESSFERSEPHSDDNYITEEEWQEQQERHEELIEQYEDAQGGGGGGVDAEGFLSQTIYGIPLIGWIVAALGLGIYFDSD